jgi:hypothetical protein
MNLLEKGLIYQRVVLIVQEKLDCPVSEIGLSGFYGFNPLDRTYPSPILSLLTLIFSRTTVRVTPSPPLVIS